MCWDWTVHLPAQCSYSTLQLWHTPHSSTRVRFTLFTHAHSYFHISVNINIWHHSILSVSSSVTQRKSTDINKYYCYRRNLLIYSNNSIKLYIPFLYGHVQPCLHTHNVHVHIHCTCTELTIGLAGGSTPMMSILDLLSGLDGRETCPLAASHSRGHICSGLYSDTLELPPSNEGCVQFSLSGSLLRKRERERESESGWDVQCTCITENNYGSYLV